MSKGIIDGAKLAAAEKSFRAMFFKLLEADPSGLLAMIARLAMSVTSKSPAEYHRWMGGIPGMTEWVGDRVLQRLAAKGFFIPNKKWANGITVAAEDIEDDNLGIVEPRIAELALAYPMHLRSLIVALITNGLTADCYDGKKFFAADHEEGDSGAQSNYSNAVLGASSYAAARAKMQELKNDKGELLNVKPNVLWCCSTLEQTALEICTAERDAAGKTNVWRNSAEPLVLPGLGSTTMWGLADLSRAYKPFVIQKRRPVRFMAQEDPNSNNVFMRDEYNYGADYRGNAGYGLWQLIHLGKA